MEALCGLGTCKGLHVTTTEERFRLKNSIASLQRQAAQLRDFNRRGDPEAVIRAFESGAAVSSEETLGEYVKALVQVDRLDSSSLLKTLQVRAWNLRCSCGGRELLAAQDAAGVPRLYCSCMHLLPEDAAGALHCLPCPMCRSFLPCTLLDLCLACLPIVRQYGGLVVTGMPAGLWQALLPRCLVKRTWRLNMFNPGRQRPAAYGAVLQAGCDYVWVPARRGAQMRRAAPLRRAWPPRGYAWRRSSMQRRRQWCRG